MKRKTITLVVYMLVCISLVSVGFAAWVITGGDQAEATGNISASTVVDESLTLGDFKWDGTVSSIDQSEKYPGGKIAFGRPESGYNTGWLQAESGDDEEKLSSVFSFSVSCDAATNLNAAVSKLTSTTLTAEHSTVVETAITKKYIEKTTLQFKVADTEAGLTSASYSNYSEALFKKALMFDDYTIAEPEDERETQQVFVAVKVEYAWGDVFGNVNPYEYFNASGIKPNDIKNPEAAEAERISWKQYAKENLKGLYETLYQDSGNGDYTALGTFSLSIKLIAPGEAA